MSATTGVIYSDSMAIVPYRSQQSSEEFLRSQTEKITNEVYRRSLELAKYEANIFPQISSSRIEIEIFEATPSDHKAPILIFSHGWGEPSRNYRILLIELASHGYTVLNLTHLSSVESIDLPPEEENARTDKLAADMVNNIQYVIGKVRSGLLKNLGDPNKIILIGHSLGGAASIIASRNNPDISGCVNLDGFLKGDAKTDGLTQPLLMIIGDYEEYITQMEQHPEEKKNAESFRESLEEYETLRINSLRRKSPHSEKIVIPGAVHMDFTDKPFRDYLAKEKTLPTAMRVHTIVSNKVLKFLKLGASVDNYTN